MNNLMLMPYDALLTEAQRLQAENAGLRKERDKPPKPEQLNNDLLEIARLVLKAQ